MKTSPPPDDESGIADNGAAEGVGAGDAEELRTEGAVELGTGASEEVETGASEEPAPGLRLLQKKSQY